MVKKLTPRHGPPVQTELRAACHRLREISSERRPRVAVLTENEFLFVYRGNVSYQQFVQESGPVTRLYPNRGEIIDFFTRIEFMVNQSLISSLSPPDATKLERVLDQVDLFSKIRLLREWDLIDGKTSDLLIKLKEVRNGFAHNWEVEKVLYRGKPITENFAPFKTDASKAFDALIDLYNGKKMDTAKLIQLLDEIERDGDA